MPLVEVNRTLDNGTIGKDQVISNYARKIRGPTDGDTRCGVSIFVRTVENGTLPAQQARAVMSIEEAQDVVALLLDNIDKAIADQGDR